MSLDRRAFELAQRDSNLAVRILKEAIRIPADHLAEDPLCGRSNHEGPRLEYLKRAVVEARAVRSEADVGFDDFGNLVWTVQDPHDGVPTEDKTVIYLDGHSDTVAALEDRWPAGLDAYDGLTDPGAVTPEVLEGLLGYVPPRDAWSNLVFGRGAADQLAGVVSQIMATRHLVELDGALSGVIVRSYATVAEEDNDGGAPMYLMDRILPGAGPELIPDAVILTEGTGDAEKGALGIYRGQRGRTQIEVRITGRSCHGSMPWNGLNPLEHGAAIIAEAARDHEAGRGFERDEFLGPGSQTASWCHLDTPSDCAVPERFVLRLDRRLTAGESAEEARRHVEAQASVAAARAAGLGVEVRIPAYTEPTWRGFRPDNPQTYPGWVTPEDHPVLRAAVQTYQRVITPTVEVDAPRGGLRRAPRVDRWIFSTDGVGYPIRADDPRLTIPASKGWVKEGPLLHPPMFGIGAGVEQNTHRIGEYVDVRELVRAIAFLTRFPSVLAASGQRP